MKETRELLFELIRREIEGELDTSACDGAQVCEEKTPLSEDLQAFASRFTPEILRPLFTLAKRHDMAHLLAEALDKLGVLNVQTQEGQAFFACRQMAVYRYEQIRYECERLYSAFEDAKIFYIPLKGAVIRALYPSPWMRTSCDVDILVNESDLETALDACAGLDYSIEGKGYHDVSLLSPGGVHLELHFSICESRGHLDRVLKRVWDNVQPARDTGYEYALTPEFFVFHNVAHAAYHFLEGGCGMRVLLDLWLLRGKTEFDEAQVRALCEEADILKFYDALVQLSEVWFAGAVRDDLTEEMENYIIDGGVYGTMQNKLSVKTQKIGKIGYFFTVAFLPYENMKVLYPVLGKHKWLLPFCWVRRWFRILFGGMSAAGRKAIRTKVSKEEVQKTAQLLGRLDLL